MNVVFIKEVESLRKEKCFAKLSNVEIGSNRSIYEINLNDVKVKNLLNNCNEKNKYFDKKIKEFKRKIVIKKLGKQLSKIILKNCLQEYRVAYSLGINKNSNLKKQLKIIFASLNIVEFLPKNEIQNNTHKYIDEFRKKNNIKLQDIVPCVIVSDSKNIDIEYVRNLNNEYKGLGVACIFTKIDPYLRRDIDKMNEEYGSCIEMVENKRDFKKYNVYIFVDFTIDKCSRYKFNKIACFINLNNKESDKYNSYYVRLRENIKKGVYFSDKVKTLCDIYGKVTTAESVL